MTKIYAILKLIRWYNCLISVLVVIVAAWLLPDYPPVNFMILACLIIFFITAFGNIHNDVIDIEADNINHPERPLPQGLLSPETASLIGTLFMLVGLSLAFLLSMKIFIVACLAAILLYLYNSFLKRIPLLSNITVAVLGALAFIFSGFLSSEYHLFEFSLINAGAVFAFWFHLGREIIKDLEDYKGDSKYGVKTLEDLLFIEIESIQAEDKFKSRLNNIRDALNSSLAYYSLIPSSYVVPLAFNGITSVYQLVQTEFSGLQDSMEIIREDTYNMARNSINLVDILTHKKTESEFRVKLSSLRAFTPKQLLKIQEVGIDNVIDLYFRLDPDRCPKSVIASVDGVKRVLEKPVAVLPLVKQAFPSKIPLLFNAGITSIIEFLFWDKDEVAEILEIKRYEISKYRKMNLSELKRKKNLGTPIRNFVRISEQYYEPLHEFGIDNIEDLYFYGKRYSELIPNDVVPEKLIKACISDLEMPIVKLADLPIPSAQELVKKGINRIIDFLYWPEESLKNVHGLSAAKTKKIKSNIRLRRKSDVLGQLDSYMGG